MTNEFEETEENMYISKESSQAARLAVSLITLPTDPAKQDELYRAVGEVLDDGTGDASRAFASGLFDDLGLARRARKEGK